METLRSFHRSCLVIWVGIIVVLRIGLDPFIQNVSRFDCLCRANSYSAHMGTQYLRAAIACPEHWAVNFPTHFLGMNFVSIIQSSLVGGLFFTGEWFIRKHLWRWRWFHSDLDFGGRWTAETTYKFQYECHVSNLQDAEQQSSGSGTTASPKSEKQIKKQIIKKCHGVYIKQDCLSINIEPDDTKPEPPDEGFITRVSLAMDIIGTSGVGYAYKVTYTDNERFPSEATGYEELTVAGRQVEAFWYKGRPVQLRGHFSHCVRENVPLYSGPVTFDRKS